MLANVVADDGSLTPQNGVRQDRVATYAGLRASAFRASDRHALKIGVDTLIENLRSCPIPLTLLSQYLPGEYAAIREGELENDPRELLLHGVTRTLRDYADACMPAS